ncbi:helix-turn-helix transcriptional regulator [Enterococcus hulanensis]|uniref:helix-turn-helix transcriptional regulator n=1 Tax=Enterococcus TaxID=1350 RepID=UPI0028922ED3|nr:MULTISPECIES: helix-turn-helix transcriptional regulator [Enterococcus]MDT2485545.1 helix-turn-helix transcriptional regulator [Enterococcus avium]MDT2512130.1 helix-turn-helix transcriptional regulator [Enterococcus avium]MDT2662713.1 helix-turn-helix transcriptional regulator [Enterococcus hulanensis]
MQWNLIRIRKEHGETQTDLASLLNLSVEGYRLKENGVSQFKSDEMFLIAEHFNLNLDEIFLPTKYTLSKQSSA